jgi:cytochrome d ubiquinol oxidase subunit I
VVYGQLRTADAVSPIAAAGVTGSLIAFVIVYSTVFAAGIFYILKLMAQAPAPHEPEEALGPTRAAGLVGMGDRT